MDRSSALHNFHGISSNLNALKQIAQMNNENMKKLVEGKQVTKPEDGAHAYLASITLQRDADSIDYRLDGIQTGVSMLGVSQSAISAIENLLDTMKGTAEDALASYSNREIQTLKDTYDVVRRQIVDVAFEAEYDGFNILLGDEDATAETYLTSPDDGGVPVRPPKTRSFEFAENLGQRVFDLHTLNIFESYHWQNTYSDGWEKTVFGLDIKENINAVECFQDELNRYSIGMDMDESIFQIRDKFIRDRSQVLRDGAERLTLTDLTEVAAQVKAGTIAYELTESTLKMTQEAEGYFKKILGIK